jgi:hypothetical protein
VPVLKDLNDYLVAYGNDTMAALQAPDASGAPARIVCSLHTGVHTCARARNSWCTEIDTDRLTAGTGCRAICKYATRSSHASIAVDQRGILQRAVVLQDSIPSMQ